MTIIIDIVELYLNDIGSFGEHRIAIKPTAVQEQYIHQMIKDAENRYGFNFNKNMKLEIRKIG